VPLGLPEALLADAGRDRLQVDDDVRKPAGRSTAMTDERVKGTLNKDQGKVEEGLGKVTENKEEQVRGKARQVQGTAQEGLGDIQNAVRKPEVRKP
jgi:CsbD-like.